MKPILTVNRDSITWKRLGTATTQALRDQGGAYIGIVSQRAAPPPLDEPTRDRMRAMRRRDTRQEVSLRSALHRAGLRFRVDYPLPGTRRRADVAFPRQQIAVFLDGCFWHGCPEHLSWPKNNGEWWRRKISQNRERDADTNRQLQEMRWTVLRFWEHEELTESAERVIATVRSTPKTIAGHPDAESNPGRVG